MPEVDQMVNTTNTTATDKEAPGAAELAIGIMLTLCGAVTLALSMVIQRYALAHPAPGEVDIDLVLYELKTGGTSCL